jgi:outer membrane protein
MRKLYLLLLFLPAAIIAQTKFGYFSYIKVLESVPQYKSATEEYNALRERCNKEISHNEEELTRHYVAFLNGQHDFPEPILRRRQNELQQMIDNSVAFRDQLKVWLAEARDSLYHPCYAVVDNALKRVCGVLSLAYAIDMDEGVYRYINPEIGIDITDYLIEAVINPAPVKNVNEDGVALPPHALSTDSSEDNRTGSGVAETGSLENNEYIKAE